MNFSAGGPFSMVTGYLSEFHSAKYKTNFTRWGGLAVNAAIIVPASKQFFYYFLINSLGHDGIKKYSTIFFFARIIKRNLGIIDLVYHRIEELIEVRMESWLGKFFYFMNFKCLKNIYV